MMRKITGLAVTALLVGAVTATPATAQARGYFGFGAGLSLPTGDFGDGLKTGWLGQVVAGITGASGVIGGRIDGQYVRHSPDVGTGHFRMIGVNADLVWTPGKRPAKMHPYLLGGVGFYNGKSSGATADGDTKFAFNLGAGLQVHLKDGMDFFAEGRWISVRSDPTTNFIPIVLGLRFGGI
jgi:opacity protein-like surface antigen